MATDKNFNTIKYNPEIFDKGVKDVKDNGGATPDQIGRMQDLQETKYPILEHKDQEQGVISDADGETYYPKSVNPIYVNPTAPTPANQEFTDSVNRKLDQVKDKNYRETEYAAQNQWYQGEGNNNTDQETAGFTFDFKGKGKTTERMEGGTNGPVAPQRSKKVWPYGIPERDQAPVPASGFSQTDGFLFNNADQSTDLVADAGASHGNLKNEVKKQKDPISGGPIGASRGARASIYTSFIKCATTIGIKDPDIVEDNLVERTAPIPGFQMGPEPTPYQEQVPPVKQVVAPKEGELPRKMVNKDIDQPNNEVSVNTAFMANIGQNESVDEGDTDKI